MERLQAQSQESGVEDRQGGGAGVARGRRR